MSEQFLNQVYDSLVEIGGAEPGMRESFIYAHTREEPCTEWRFSGRLGFGGKYRSRTNRVDCYREDQTVKRLTIIARLNDALAAITS